MGGLSAESTAMLHESCCCATSVTSPMQPIGRAQRESSAMNLLEKDSLIVKGVRSRRPHPVREPWGVLAAGHRGSRPGWRHLLPLQVPWRPHSRRPLSPQRPGPTRKCTSSVFVHKYRNWLRWCTRKFGYFLDLHSCANINYQSI